MSLWYINFIKNKTKKRKRSRRYEIKKYIKQKYREDMQNKMYKTIGDNNNRGRAFRRGLINNPL